MFTWNYQIHELLTCSHVTTKYTSYSAPLQWVVHVALILNYVNFHPKLWQRAYGGLHVCVGADGHTVGVEACKHIYILSSSDVPLFPYSKWTNYSSAHDGWILRAGILLEQVTYELVAHGLVFMSSAPLSPPSHFLKVNVGAVHVEYILFPLEDMVRRPPARDQRRSDSKREWVPRSQW